MSFSSLRSESWLRIKPLCLSKAGAFSSVLGMPEWLQCSVVFMNAFRWCLFFMQHICVPSFPSPKKTTTQLLSLQIPNRCYAVATAATRFFFQFEGCFWGVASCTICMGTYFKRTGGMCEAIGKRSMNVLVLLTACLKSLTLQWFLATIAIFSLSVVRF